MLDEHAIHAALDALIQTHGHDITGAAFVTYDGIVVAARIRPDAQLERGGAMTAALTSIMLHIGEAFRIGTMEEAVIFADTGILVLCFVAPALILAVTLSTQANLGWIRRQMRKLSMLMVLEPPFP